MERDLWGMGSFLGHLGGDSFVPAPWGRSRSEQSHPGVNPALVKTP